VVRYLQEQKQKVSVRVATLLRVSTTGYSDSSGSIKLRHLLSIPEESDEAREGDRGMRGLQFGHQHPSLPPAIRAGGIGPSFRQRVPAQTCVYVRQDDRQRSVHEKDLPRQPRRFDEKWVTLSSRDTIRWAEKTEGRTRTDDATVGRRRDDILEVLKFGTVRCARRPDGESI
jgi:hypothetical protein